MTTTLKYRIISTPETGEMVFGSNDLTHAEWLARELLADFGNSKVFQYVQDNNAGEPVFRLLRSYSCPTDKQQALNL